MTPTILLDLDGTLIDSAPGIYSSLRHAFSAHGLPVPDDATLRTFVGPPIHDSMRRHHVPEELVEPVVASYREAFADGGLYDATVYEGVPAALGSLRDAGVRLVVATAKPEVFAGPIVERLGLDRYVDAVFGAPLDEGTSKGDIIARAVATSAAGLAAGSLLMVGDREHDVHGALENGLRAVGVRWGYAQPGELERAGATTVVEHPDELVPTALDLVRAAA